MRIHEYYFALVCFYFLRCYRANALEYNVTLSHDGPVVLGGTITFKADVYVYDERPTGTFKYQWSDNALKPHNHESGATSNTTTFWSLTVAKENYTYGIYEVEVIVSEWELLWWKTITSVRTKFVVTEFLNGDLEVTQPNLTSSAGFVSSASEANLTVRLRHGDIDCLNNATSLLIYWFIDCRFFGSTGDFNFPYNFTKPDVPHTLEALIVASFDAPTVTTTEITPTEATIGLNATEDAVNNDSNAMTTTTSTAVTSSEKGGVVGGNVSLPYVCSNSSIVPPDPSKVYGHFVRKIQVRAPLANITVEGTNWIQPWAMLSLNVSCKGSGPFEKCLSFHRGKYNVTGNETCENYVNQTSCNFSIIHYFLEPSVYTIVIVLHNQVSKLIYPLTINIYKVTTKPQLSVIVLPVSCSLAALVLIIFGIAYYIQSRARFTVEVADFDFGQNNPEMEYKTFGERLRDSFNGSCRPGGVKRISGYKSLSNSQTLQ